jgi:hypothetical protein
MIAFEPWQIAYLATPAIGISNVPLHLLWCLVGSLGGGFASKVPSLTPLPIRN